MKKVPALAACIFFMYAVCGYAASSAPVYQEGQWEITTAMDIPGMPKEMNKPYVYKICLNKKNPVPQLQSSNNGEMQCKMVSQTVNGNTVTWKMTCKNDIDIEGKITYSKTSYEGKTITTAYVDGKKMVMKSTMKGKYIGPCPN